MRLRPNCFFNGVNVNQQECKKKHFIDPWPNILAFFFWKSIVVSMQRLCDFASASCMSLVLCLSNDWQRIDIKYRDCTSYHESWRIKIQQSDMEYIYQAIIAVLWFSTPPSSNKAYNPHEIGWAFCSGYLQGGRESLLNMQISWLVDYKSTVFLCGWIEWRCFLGLSKTVWSRGSFALRVFGDGLGTQIPSKKTAEMPEKRFPIPYLARAKVTTKQYGRFADQ